MSETEHSESGSGSESPQQHANGKDQKSTHPEDVNEDAVEAANTLAQVAAQEGGIDSATVPVKKRGRPAGSAKKRKQVNSVPSGGAKKARGRPRKNPVPGAASPKGGAGPSSDHSLEALLNTAQAARLPMQQRASKMGAGMPSPTKPGEDLMFSGGFSMANFMQLKPEVQIEFLKTQRFSQSMGVLSQAYKSIDT